jgi:hypothetical protein
MVVVAQLVERRLVVPDVAGSSPVSHPQRLILDANEIQESPCQLHPGRGDVGCEAGQVGRSDWRLMHSLESGHRLRN